MKAKKIRKKRNKYLLKYGEILAKLKELQNECPHPKKHVRIKHGSDLGNWHKQDDCYWTDYHCYVCDKRWSVDGSHSEVIVE